MVEEEGEAGGQEEEEVRKEGGEVVRREARGVEKRGEKEEEEREGEVREAQRFDILVFILFCSQEELKISSAISRYYGTLVKVAASGDFSFVVPLVCSSFRK